MNRLFNAPLARLPIQEGVDYGPVAPQTSVLQPAHPTMVHFHRFARSIFGRTLVAHGFTVRASEVDSYLDQVAAVMAEEFYPFLSRVKNYHSEFASACRNAENRIHEIDAHFCGQVGKDLQPLSEHDGFVMRTLKILEAHVGTCLNGHGIPIHRDYVEAVVGI